MIPLRRAVAVLLLLLVSHAGLAATAGRFLSVVGDVRVVAEDGDQRRAGRGAILNSGDTVVTGRHALAQLRLVDGGMVSVRADTEFKLADYRYEEREPSLGRMFVNLVRGSFRSITGLIGRRNPDGYRINTPHATIGVRGTDHETTVTVRALEGFSPGTFDVVYSGATRMTTRAGFVDIGPKQAAYVGSASVPPKVVPVPQFLRSRPPVAATPAPQASPQAKEATESAGDGEGGRAAAKTRPRLGEPATPRARLEGDAPAAGDEAAEASAKKAPLLINPLMNPSRTSTLQRNRERVGAPDLAPRPLERTLDTTRTLTPTTTLKTLDPATTARSPTTTLRTLDPATTTISPTTTLRTLEPTTTTISPTTTLRTLEPTTTTISPTTTLRTLEPSTTTLSPTTTLRTLEPTTTTISPTTTLKTLEPSTTTLEPTTTIRTLEPTTTISPLLTR